MHAAQTARIYIIGPCTINKYYITGDISKYLLRSHKNYLYCTYDVFRNNKFNKYNIRPSYPLNNVFCGLNVKRYPLVNGVILHSTGITARQTPHMSTHVHTWRSMQWTTWWLAVMSPLHLTYSRRKGKKIIFWTHLHLCQCLDYIIPISHDIGYVMLIIHSTLD